MKSLVRIISAESPDKLEETLNAFLKDNSKVINISYQIRPDVNQDIFSALVLYVE